MCKYATSNHFNMQRLIIKPFFQAFENCSSSKTCCIIGSNLFTVVTIFDVKCSDGIYHSRQWLFHLWFILLPHTQFNACWSIYFKATWRSRPIWRCKSQVIEVFAIEEQFSIFMIYSYHRLIWSSSQLFQQITHN